MFYIKHYFYLFLVSILLYSCSYSNKNKKELLRKEQDLFELRRIDSAILILDEVTPNITYASYFDDNTNKFYFFANDYITSYDIYDQAIYKIPINHKFIKRLSCFRVVEDYLIIVDYDNQTIVHIGYDGKVIDQIRIDNNVELPLTGATPIFSINGNYYFTSNSLDNSYSVVSLNKDQKYAKLHLAYPLIYKYNWGAFLLRIPYACYNIINNTITISFPADHYIYILNCDDNSLCTYFSGSKYIKETNPIGRNRIGVENNSEIAHYKKNNSYSNILYDRFNDVYYRIAELPNHKISPMESKSLSIIILDSKFNIIGETLLYDKFISTYRYTPFINEKGLYIQLLSSEEEIIFGIYKLIQNE